MIHNLISVDQTAYVKGRFIGESIRVINDLIQHIDREDEEGILFSTDIEKALNTVYHNFLFATLKRYGFGTKFVNFIKTLLFDAQSCIINNGYTTDYFKLERGTRQGDPLSAYLFILVFEVLFIQVREDIDIKGFTVNDVELKLSCYADDGYFMVKTVDSLKKILRYFDIYSLYSSLKVNLEKCEACWLGRAKFREDKPIACKWTALNNGCVRILGSFFSYDPLLSHKVNFLSVTASIHTIVNRWKQRDLTLGGRIQVFKSLIFSKLVYASSVQYRSGDVVKEICKIQKDFIGRGKRPKIKHSTLIGNFENGGLKDINIESKLKALKLSWIKRLLDSNFHLWKTSAAKLSEPVGGTKIFHSNLSMSKECHKGLTSLPTFYKQLIEFWELTSIGICDEPSFILNQSVWNNKHITRSGSPLFDTTLSNKGINYIKDIFNTITCDFKLWNEVKTSSDFQRV